MRQLFFAALLLGACVLALNAAAPNAPTEPAADVDDTQDVLYVGQPYPVMLRLHFRVDRKAAIANWDERMAAYFTFLDRNGNKKLDKTEAEKAVTATQMVQFFQGNSFVFNNGRGTSATVVLTDLDTDRDGQVTSEEFIEYYVKNGAGPVVMGNAVAQGGFAGFDAYGVDPKRSQDGNTDAIFSLLDTNKDGKLSTQETQAALRAILKYDANDDELVSQSELGLAGQNRGSGRLAILQGGRMPAAKTAPPPSNLMLIPREEGKRAAGKLEVAREVITRYDKDKDGSLSVDELGLPLKAFQALDRNKDDKLSALELVRWLTGKLAGEFDVRLIDQGGAMMARGGMAAPKAKKGDEMSVSLEGVRINVVPQSSMNVRYGNDQFAKQQFQQAAEEDKRGFVTRKQVAENRTLNAYLGATFDMADRDNDGKLTTKEFDALIEAITSLRGAQVSLSIYASGNGLFQMLDANGDSQLSPHKLRTASKRLAELDGNGDGYVSRTEFPQQFQLSISQGSAAGGIVQTETMRGDARRPRGRGPVWFARADRNGDGDVSRAEWLGEKEDFDAIDVDGDDLISPEEAEAYDAKAHQ